MSTVRDKRRLLQEFLKERATNIQIFEGTVEKSGNGFRIQCDGIVAVPFSSLRKIAVDALSAVSKNSGQRDTNRKTNRETICKVMHETYPSDTTVANVPKVGEIMRVDNKHAGKPKRMRVDNKHAGKPKRMPNADICTDTLVSLVRRLVQSVQVNDADKITLSDILQHCTSTDSDSGVRATPSPISQTLTRNDHLAVMGRSTQYADSDSDSTDSDSTDSDSTDSTVRDGVRATAPKKGVKHRESVHHGHKTKVNLRGFRAKTRKVNVRQLSAAQIDGLRIAVGLKKSRPNNFVKQLIGKETLYHEVDKGILMMGETKSILLREDPRQKQQVFPVNNNVHILANVCTIDSVHMRYNRARWHKYALELAWKFSKELARKFSKSPPQKVKILGHGAHGVVVDIGNDRVAKLLPLYSIGACEKFALEKLLAFVLSEANVAPTYEGYRVSPSGYNHLHMGTIIMEKYSSTVAQIVNHKNKISPLIVRNIVQLLHKMSALETVYCTDVKFDNMMVNANHDVRMIDFGDWCEGPLRGTKRTSKGIEYAELPKQTRFAVLVLHMLANTTNLKTANLWKQCVATIVKAAKIAIPTFSELKNFLQDQDRESVILQHYTSHMLKTFNINSFQHVMWALENGSGSK